MTRAELRSRLDREPFEPFRVHVTDGRHYDIRDPKLAVPTENRLFIVFERDGFADVVLRHVTAIESIGNGAE